MVFVWYTKYKIIDKWLHASNKKKHLIFFSKFSSSKYLVYFLHFYKYTILFWALKARSYCHHWSLAIVATLFSSQGMSGHRTSQNTAEKTGDPDFEQWSPGAMTCMPSCRQPWLYLGHNLLESGKNLFFVGITDIIVRSYQFISLVLQPDWVADVFK